MSPRFVCHAWTMLLLIFSVNALASASAWAVTPPKVIYEIFPRSFQDSDGDGVGDLQGVISRLDYLNDGTSHSLGVDAIWLTPIYPSPSYHGYDIKDYESVRTEYGDLGVLKRLISEAHKHGIRVLLDIAINHTSIQHPWFSDQSLYLFSQRPLDWHLGQGKWNRYGSEYYFSSFSAGMPDLNWRNSVVLSRMEEVFKFWVSVGVDGFRLDAAKFLIKGPQGQDNQPETHEIWKQIVRATRAVAPETFFVGEVWDSAQNIATYYGNGDELDAAFDFPTMSAIRAAFQKREAGVFASALRQRLSVQPTETFAAPFAGNHDLPRLASQAGNDVNLEKLAAVAVMTLPGSAEVYYGDEIGIPQGGQPGDMAKRTPMQWDNSPMRGFTTSAKPWTGLASNTPATSVKSQEADPVSLLNGYKKLIHLRAGNSFFYSGVISEVRTPAPGVVSYLRSDPGKNTQSALVLLNFSNAAAATLQIPLGERVPGDNPPVTAWGHAQAAFNSNGIQVSNLAAESAAIFILGSDN